jgi:membrane protein DedA with SNARE-associated domain
VLENIGQWVQDVMGSLGYVGLALLLVLENLFPPIPSEVVLPLAGFFVGTGDFTFWGHSSPRRSGRRPGRSSCTAWGGGVDAR